MYGQRYHLKSECCRLVIFAQSLLHEKRNSNHQNMTTLLYLNLDRSLKLEMRELDECRYQRVKYFLLLGVLQESLRHHVAQQGR